MTNSLMISRMQGVPYSSECSASGSSSYASIDGSKQGLENLEVRSIYRYEEEVGLGSHLRLRMFIPRPLCQAHQRYRIWSDTVSLVTD